MTLSIKRGLGLFGILGIVLFLAAGASGDESQNTGPATATQGNPPTPPSNLRQQSDPCGGMMGEKGMARMGMRPGPGMGMPGMAGMGGAMGMPGMEMGGMDMPGMGMMPMMQERMMMRMMARNPKLAGKMLQMRADIMRAVADVLTKYGKEMESGQWPAQGNGEADD